ncbi:hypothetical protein SLA2020_424680 [Shorea laevis]
MSSFLTSQENITQNEVSPKSYKELIQNRRLESFTRPLSVSRLLVLPHVTGRYHVSSRSIQEPAYGYCPLQRPQNRHHMAQGSDFCHRHKKFL